MLTNYLSSGTKNKQNTPAKIDIANARIVSRAQGSFVGIFGARADDGAFDMQGGNDLMPTAAAAVQQPDPADENGLL